MPNVYRVSSTVKVAQMEAELSAQLSALRTEVEENGVPLGEAPSKSYSSVPLPKDISFFRTEREQALRRGLQVSEALPVVSPAQVIQAELDSCLNMEYTAESLPPLLHQFYADRSYQLAQLKHQLMLRWTRFCRHSGVIEKMYPHYKKQMSYMMNEYDDAVQRARRLAVSREKILTDRGNPINVVTQDDVVIYLKWLVCHLHSVKTIHNFLHVIHYIPSRDRKDKGESSQQTFTKDHLNEPQHLNGLVEDLPIHTVQLTNFRAELHSLVSYFHLPYDIVNLRTTGDEMELFSMVSREFRTIFRKQELMKTFPQCDSTEVKDSQWGRKSPSMALKKEANWIPFIQVKPLKQDPWQKKLITKLKEHHSVDELLKMYCRFLQASDLLQVCEALRQHAAHVCEMQGGRSSSVASHTQADQKNKSIFNVAAISEDTKMVGSSRLGTMRGLDKRGWKSKVMPVTTKSKSYSYMDSVQLLGLDGSPEEGTSDPIITRGAYLSLIYLRHLKIRELQRVSLGMLNYLRSVERTLTIDLAGLCSKGEGLVVTADETGWMNAARGGSGLAGGLGSLHYSHNSPVDYKVQCSEFMEFPEVENLHDFYSTEGRFIHTQDQRGLYVVYDVALQDLEEQENLLAIVASQFIQRNRKEQVGKFEGSVPSASDVHSWPLGRTDVDCVAVLLDVWTCETEFLESKVQLLNCYYEAYQHVSGCEERFAMAQVITDIMHRRPQLDLGHDYFVQAYRAEMACLQSHHSLIRAVLDCQIDQQRQYIQRIWRGDQTGSVNEYGLPPNYVPKHLVSLGGGSPALNNIFLLEVHPSLCLAASVYHTLAKAHTELCQLQGAVGLAERVNLEHGLLQQALQNWSTLTLPGASYSSQTQKDLFSDVFFDDPTLVQGVGLSLIRSAEERDMRHGKEKQFHAVETLSKLLELVSIRHRLLESASETAHLSQLYRNLAIELGFDEFHLYMRPVQFELAVHKDKLEHGPVFITALLEDNSCVDRYIPSSLPLSIQELDESQIGRFSFNSEETVVHLMSRPSIENLQVTLACQVAQKNALVSVVKQVCLCYWAETSAGPTEGQESIPSDNEAKSSTGLDSQTCRDNDSIKKKAESVPSKAAKSSVIGNKNRQMEAFVSIQLEKVGLRDEMLNSFFKKKQAMGGLIKTPEEVAKIKRKLILEFCKRFSMHMSQYCVRAQIIAYCYSLTSLLHDSPIIRQSNFMIGQASEQKVCLDSEVDLCPDPRTFQRRLRRLLSADGKAIINLWFIPHYSEVLRMFKTIDAAASAKGLHHTLEIMSSLHDIVYYLVSFARLGNTGEPFSSLSWRRRPEEAQPHLSADWGGTEGIGAELWDIQRQVDSLSDPGSPEAVSRLLQLRRQVLFLQFDNAVRHLIREAFLSSGDMVSYQSVSDNMVSALPLLSDSIRPTIYSSLLSVPQPLEPQSLQAQRMYPWRCFLACHGLHPVDICDIPHIEYCMQLCLSGLGDEGRIQANAAMLGVSLLMEDVLGSGLEVEPLCLHDNKNDDFPHGKCDEEDKQCLEAENEETHVPDSMVPLRDPIQVQSVLKGFLQLTKQLQVFKESWARTHLAVKRINTPSLYRQFLKLYRSEIFYPSMRALALQLGKECEYEALISRNQSLLPPPGASEVDVKAWQLHKLLECTECDMIRTVQKRINRELTVVISERTRQDTGLPTELWIKAPLKHTLSPERPQVVERFIHQLMENAEEVDGQVRVSEAHLRGCLTELGCSVMERERCSFLLYSQFYEQILQQQTQLLYQKEQDIKNLDKSHTPQNEVAALCRGMMLEMSALQARVTQLEEENNTLEEQLSLKYRQQYDAWVRQLLSTCIQLKARLDEYHRRMEQDVCQLVSKVRGEGVDRIIKLRKKYGSTQEDDSLSLLLMEKDYLHEFKMENSQLSSLLCKVKALGHWRQVLHQGKLHRQLLQSQQREVICRREALRVKMMSEEEVVILQEELDATKQALHHCQTEYSRTRMNLSRKTEALHAARLQSAQEARSRQEMERHHGHSLEQMRGDMEDRERRLRELRQQLDRDGRGSQLQRQRSAKDIQQMKNQLHKERSLKQEAYQQVDKLQNQMNDHESTLSRCTSTPGLARTSQQYGNQTRDSSLVDFGAKHGHLKSRCDTKLERPKVDPSCLRALTAETLLPELFKL